MSVRIKNFSKFQHFKDRSPPWVKLYRDILDDPDWHELEGESAKILVALWLIASEDPEKAGSLPDARKLCFRLRVQESVLNKALSRLSHWLERDDIELISDRYQLDAPEERRDRGETDTCSPSASESADDGFASFWGQYPKKVAKPAAEKAWKKARPDLDIVLKAIAAQASSDAWRKDSGQFIPNPATWINQRRWEDELPQLAAQQATDPGNSVFAGAI